MSRLFGVDPIKARQSAIVSRHVDAFLAAGHQIVECPVGQETWKLWAVEQPNGDIVFKRAKALPDDLAERKAAREERERPKWVPQPEGPVRALSGRGRKRKEGTEGVYRSDKPCKRGHQGMRYSRNGDCVECARLRSLESK